MRARLADMLLRRPWATVLPLVVLLPFLLSGAVRFSLGWSLERSLLACGTALALAMLGFGLPRLPASGRVATLGTFAVALTLVACTYRLWWTPVLHGLPNTSVGVDVGNHIITYQRFIGAHHRQYEGFVGLYALMYWYERLSASHGVSPTASMYYALRFAHYAAVLSIPVALALVVHPSLASLKGRAEQFAALLLTLPVQVCVLAVLVFPPVQYYQAAGFYAQIAGLFPLLFGWLLFGLCEDAGERLVVCGFWLVVQRFTYGLNLGDAFLTCAILWSLDLRELGSTWLRWGARLFIPAALGGAYLVYLKLWPLRGMQGYFTEHSIGWLLPSELVLSLALLVAPSAFSSVAVSVSDAARRLWRYAGTFGLINGTITVLYLASGAPQRYYIFKYSLYAVVLVMISSVGPVAVLIAHLISKGSRSACGREALRVLAGGVAMYALVLLGLWKGHQAYHTQAVERYERTKPPVQLYSHFEPRVDAFIDRTLSARNAQFGGYYDPFWSRMFLMNALRFQLSSRRDYVFNRAFERAERMFPDEPGKCYFWLGKPEDYAGALHRPMGEHLRELNAQRASCERFPVQWSENEQTVCATCF